MRNRREEILMAALELAAEKGLGNVSLHMIANKVGIKKPSLYNHFASKEELVEAMYEFLREQAKANANIPAVDYSALFAGKTALEILQQVVGGYIRMTSQKNILTFYKVIYSCLLYTSGTPDGMMTLRLIPELCRMRFAYPAYTRCQVR